MSPRSLAQTMAATIVDGLYPGALSEPGEVATFLRQAGYSPMVIADNLVGTITIARQQFECIRDKDEEANAAARAEARANGAAFL